MQRILLLLAALLAAAATLGGSPAAAVNAAGSLTSPQNAQLDRYRADVMEGFRTASAAALLRAHGNEVRLMPAYQPTLLGKAHAEAYHRAFLARFAVSRYERNAVEQLDLGRQVAEFGLYSMSLTPHDGSEPVAVQGKYLDLWEKKADGALTLITALWCHDWHPKNADQFRFAEVPSVRMAHERELPYDHPWRFEFAAFNALEEDAIIQRDGKTWSQFFADDATIYANVGPLVRGRAAVDGYVTAHAKELPVFEHLDIRTDRVDETGEYLIAYSSHVVSWRIGDMSGVTTGKGIKVLRRQPNGVLKTVRSISSYD